MPVTAIIVARGGSVRLPGKALLPFADSSILGHKIDTLRKCRNIHRVVVGSDDDAILNEAVMHGADAVRRDAYHCDERRCTANEMLYDMADLIGGSVSDVIVWAHPTNPLVSPETYDRAVDEYRDSLAYGYDSLCSVYPMQRHAWVDGRPFNFNPRADRHPLAKELKTVHFQNGAIFIQTRGEMLANSYFYGSKPYLFPMNEYESTDVDDKADYELALCRLASSAPVPV